MQGHMVEEGPICFCLILLEVEVYADNEESQPFLSYVILMSGFILETFKSGLPIAVTLLWQT